ncbi:MAG TPA: transporter [Pseudolabrys sp.]|nr:transporter [Pseudolabrys sp.]
MLLSFCFSNAARADEGGVSFWVPGFFGSLAATPLQPGFSFTTIYYHTSVSAGGDVAFARQVNRGNITANFTGSLNANLDGRADLVMAAPSYTFADRFLGGQATLVLLVPYGRSRASVDATLTGAPGPIGFTVSGERTDAVTGFGDLVPQFNVRWNAGVHNFMTYLTGNLTTGRYDPTRLANLGIGHNAIDGGGGYTYFNPQTRHEFSATLGFTYNLENVHTQYQNGVDMHLDVGASQFLSKQFSVGLVGYWYNQLSCDSGAGDRVGCFKSRVAGIGPQISYIFPVTEHYQGFLNVKGYKEFAAEHRADGWNVWLTLAFSPAAKQEAAAKKAMITK